MFEALVTAVRSAVGPALPYERGSPAELLAATHIFVVRPTAIETTPWAPGPDGLQHRSLVAQLALGPVLKGQVAPAAAFTLWAPQRREDALTVSDWHGFWSHAELRPEAVRVALAEGPGTDPAALLLDPAIRDLLPPEAANDVAGAVLLEQRHAVALRAGGPGAVAAARAVLADLARGRTRCGGPLGRYVWVRIGPTYEVDEVALLAAGLAIALAPDTTAGLRAAMVEGLNEAVLDLEPTPARRAGLLGPLLRLLPMPAALPMRERLVQAILHGLAFDPQSGDLPVALAVPNAAERASLAAAIGEMPGERPAALAAWLRGVAGR